MLLPDPVNVIEGMLAGSMHGPMHEFRFSRGGGFTGIQAERLMRQYGIRVFGRLTNNPEQVGFKVKQSQAIWAEYLLLRAGVPLVTPLLDPRNRDYQRRHTAGEMPTPWQEEGIRAHSIIDHLVDWLDGLFGGK